jgi:rhamnosyltransferase
MIKRDFYVSVVIVLYNPDICILEKVIEKLSRQVTKIVIVDNSPKPYISRIRNIKDNIKEGYLEYLPLYTNQGIAKAQNVGYNQVASCSDYLLFFDQDSIPDDRLVENLINSYNKLNYKGVKIGGIGPRVINIETGMKEFPKVNKGHQVMDGITEVSQLMSSGTLIKPGVMEDVGMMEEALFIDDVEFEWCWRAAQKGYSFFLSEAGLLYHRTGEATKRILGMPLHITTPFRKYYQYRNFLILLTRNYVPLYWKLSNLVKYAFKFFYYPIFIPPRYQYLKRMLQGVRAGIYYLFYKKII